MSELKAYTYDDMLDGVADVNVEFYQKSEVDAAIAELKNEITRKEGVEKRWFDGCMEARAENVRLKRALWLSRAERARDNSILLPSKFMRNVWDNVERKCRDKAEEYK